MKPFKPYPLKLSGILLLFFVLQSCVEKPGLWKNDQIKSGKRDDFHALNEQAFRDLKANDAKRLGLIMSKELLENRGTVHNVEVIGNHLNDFSYTLLDEYYVVTAKKGEDSIKATGTASNRYSIFYPDAEKEMYFAFFVPKTGANKSMVSLVYAKLSYGWKLTAMEISPYTVNGKTAPELFELAKEEYGKKYMINAENTMTLASTCLKPASIWEYPNEIEMTDFYGKVMSEANGKYRFPITFSQLPTSPMVLRVYNKNTDEGSFPMVYYMTHISIKDTNAVKAENIQIKKLLYKAVPGLDKYNKYVYYEAFNKFPSGAESVDRFDMVDKY